ncbi:hypothetical protein [Nocardiopsis sp. NPDC057823]|uniref:hypothetical protein n=1 Tax=Nocardiopsis sp. NPDC057823 TaxID=3346256 RepID=UPI00366F1E50
MNTELVVLLLACGLVGLVAVLVGVAAAYLARRDQATWPKAITLAAAAFAATITLITAVTVALATVVP